MLSLVFTKVDPEAVAAYVWHPDVSVYAVTDARDGAPVGYFHLDLHPRQGKYG
jgi:Zn-dependent oligopeptidase